MWPTILKAVSQVGLAGLVGAVSGSVMGGGAQLMSRGTLQQMGSEMRSTDSLNKLIETGKSLDPSTSAYRMVTRLETRTNAGKGVSDLDIGRQYAANQFAEGAEQRTAFRADLDAAEMDQRTVKTALRVYDKLVQGESISQRSAEKLQGGYDRLAQGGSESKRAAAKLQASLRSAAAQKAEINADSTVNKTEALTRLQPLYSAMQRAAQTRDFAAFQAAKEQYAQSFDLEQAKHRAAKVRVQNRINAIDNDVKAEISNAETSVKAQPPAAAINNGLNTAVAGTKGRVTDEGSAVRDAANGAAGRESILGNAAKDEAQGQFAASTPTGDSGILNPEGTGSEQGPGEGAGEDSLFRGDDLLYTDKRPNGISKSHINATGDLIPANVDGLYKGREVTVIEHILGGYRKGAKGNSPYTSFTSDQGIVANYGNSVIKVGLTELIGDINAGKVQGVKVFTPEQVRALIKYDVQESEYWRQLALKWAQRDKEYLIKGIIPQKYITVITNGGV